MQKKDRRPAKKLVKKRGQGGGGTLAKNPKKKNTTMGKPNTGSSGMDMVSKAARPAPGNLIAMGCSTRHGKFYLNTSSG
jgi:hypothetical protein